MSKALYLVNVIPQRKEGETRSSDHVSASNPDRQRAGEFVETIRASNRREAMILVRRMYPGYLVLDDVVKAP
jgi:hypothetical protein